MPNGDVGLTATRTRSTGPWPTAVVAATADAAFGRFKTSRRGASLGSWMLKATSGPLQSDSPYVVSRMAIEPANLAEDG